MLRGLTRWFGWLVVVALAWGSFGGQAFAQKPPDSTQTVTVTATVNTTFTLTLDASTITLTGDPGDTKTQARIATVKSNFTAGPPWQLQIKKDQDLTDSTQTPSQTIASAQFTHTSTGGAGTHDDTSDTTFPTAAALTTYYIATGAEKTNLPGGTAITSTYKLVIPANQAAGAYSNVITHTLISP